MLDQTILENLKTDDRPIQACILVLAGPERLLPELGMERLKQHYDKVLFFHVPDDYGEFPDTSGYTSKNWEKLVADMEDPALYKYMTKCVDAAVEFNNKRVAQLDKLGFMDIEGFLHAPKFGGKVFAVAGFVRAYAPNIYGKPRVWVPGTVH